MNGLILAVKIVILILFLLISFAYTMWAERRLLGLFQLRWGPNRVGRAGLLQPLADALKMLFKEDLLPGQADPVVFRLAPVISVFAALGVDAVIPFGAPAHLAGRTIPLDVANPPAGLLVAFGLSSLGIYGLVLAGWASQNKYSLLGGIRSAAQIISYELAMGVSALGVLMLAGSANLSRIVEAQARHGWFWWKEPLPLAVFFLTAVAESNRTPFDLPEAESELVGGYHTEYSGIRFAMFFIAEYVNMITVSALTVTLFFGGWLGPAFLPPVIWFLLKMGIFIFLFVWMRATLPRLKYDRLMHLGWQVLLPLSFVWALGTAAVVALR
ncbi:MAG: NADH-quinone oxidoreductase subunit NuoH [Firmicutes bacterium]|nr:NADH-quinone oxidoreductase subunit NuoH [Bacillota bacterium]